MIFDFDGVIADTEALGAEVSAELLRGRFGIELSDDDRRSFFGLFDYTYYARLRDKYGLRCSAEELTADHYAVYDRRILGIDVPLPGVESLARALADGGWKLAICSGSFRRQISAVLTNQGLDEYFDVIVSAEDTEDHKPDPGPYLLTAARLGLAPGSCVALEDSEPGVTAAQRAGMYCIGVEIGNHGTQDLCGADWVLPSLEPLDLAVLDDLTQHLPTAGA